MPVSIAVPPPGTTPQRGDLFPTLTGPAGDGRRVSTRDWYMRRNLAVVVLDRGKAGLAWLQECARLRPAAQAEAGEIVAIVPHGSHAPGLPCIVDRDGRLRERLGLNVSSPALFILDRYGTVFAANNAGGPTPDLEPADIPGWLEFIACRCT